MYPSDLKYSKNHIWIKENLNIITIGMTYYFQKTYGNVVYIELPEINDTVIKNEYFGVIESNKASNDLISPVSGKVIDVNKTLFTKPVTINNSPYEDGWILKIELSEPINGLLTAEEYTKEL